MCVCVCVRACVCVWCVCVWGGGRLAMDGELKEIQKNGHDHCHIPVEAPANFS